MVFSRIKKKTMMKKTAITLLSWMLLTAGNLQAQGVWEVPDTETPQPTKSEIAAEKKAADAHYLRGAVPVVDGRVTWTLEVAVPGKSAAELYDQMMELLTTLTKEEGQLEDSRVSLVNREQHMIVATINEWLLFKSTAIMLDRTQMRYVFTAECSDGKVRVQLSRFKYLYGEKPSKQLTYKAEEWITDEVAVNKKNTRLYPVSAKFRRKTIDRKDELFARVKATLLGESTGR